MLKSIGLWIIPLFFILAGQIIGFVISLALDKPHLKQMIFNIAYVVSFLGFVATCFSFEYSSWRHKRDFGNIEANQDHFKYFSGRYATEEKIAFDSLSKVLVDPNSFQLTGSQIDRIDTILNGHKQAIFITTLHYKKENQEATLKAKFAVINNTAQLFYYDIPLDKEDNYQIDSLGRAVIKTFNDAMRVLPDSLKKEVEKDFGDIMDK